MAQDDYLQIPILLEAIKQRDRKAMIKKSHDLEVQILFNASLIAIGGFLLSVAIAAVLYFVGVKPPQAYNLTTMTLVSLISIGYVVFEGCRWRFGKSESRQFVDYRVVVLTLLVFVGLLVNTYSNTITLFYRSELIVKIIQDNAVINSIHYNLLSTVGFLLFLWSSYLSGVMNRRLKPKLKG